MASIVLGKCGGKDVKIDLGALLRGRMLVQGGSGSGKSYALRRIFEQLSGKEQIFIFDIEGEFASLREKHDYVLVGKGGDTPADCRSAAMLAHRLLELRASAIFDLYEMKASERHRWARLFLEAMIDAPKSLWHPVVVAVDEAHSLCPEKGSGESEAADAMIALATRGRKRGFSALFATQRIGKLRKDAAAELTNILVGGTWIDIDRKRAAEALGVPTSEQKAFFDEVKMLEPGHFFALGRAVSTERILVKVGPVATTHPEAGWSRASSAPPVPTERVRALLPKLEDLPKEAEQKAKTEAELRTEIRSLKAQLATRPKEQVQKVVTKTFEKPAMKDVQIKRVEAILSKAADVASAFARASGELEKATAVFRGGFAKAVESYSAPRQCRHLTPPDRPAKASPPEPSNGKALEKAERKILTVLAQHQDTGCAINKLALLTGYRISGGFKNALAMLRVARFIVGANCQSMRITGGGLTAIEGQWDPLPSGRALAEFWLSHPTFGAAEKSILKTLLASPDGLAISELAERTNYSVSGGFKNALSSLRTAGCITGRNTEAMRACPELLEAVGILFDMGRTAR